MLEWDGMAGRGESGPSGTHRAAGWPCARGKPPEGRGGRLPRRRRTRTESAGPSPLLDDALARKLAAAALDRPCCTRTTARQSRSTSQSRSFRPMRIRADAAGDLGPQGAHQWRALPPGVRGALAAHLGVPHVALFNNATIALVVALRALGLTGEVVTTPYSFVATSHALMWSGLTPVFADIDPVTLKPRPEGRRGGDHATHQRDSARALLWPAMRRRRPRLRRPEARPAHRLRRGPCLRRAGRRRQRPAPRRPVDPQFPRDEGLHTFEGGAIVCHDLARKEQIDKLKNFGHDGETSVIEVGINGKMSEFNAALGLLQLRYVDGAIAARGTVDAAYGRGSPYPRHRLSRNDGAARPKLFLLPNPCGDRTTRSPGTNSGRS